MTIEKTGSRSQATGNGVTVAFSFPFRFINATDLQVFLTSGGVDTLQVLTTDYTVSNTGTESGGTVTFLVAPLDGVRVTINRSIPITQETDYTANDPFPAETHEAALDKLTLALQEQGATVARSIKLPATSTLTSLELSSAVANAAVVFNDDATGLISGPTTTDIANAGPNAAIAAQAALDAEAAKDAAEAAAETLNGSAVPNGGATNQVLAKASSANADTEWQTLATVARSGAYGDLSGVPTPPANLTQVQVENDASTVFGLVSGQRLSQAARAVFDPASGTFTTASAVDIPLVGTFDAARVVVEITAASVADAGLSARFTRDAFSTVVSGASDYRWQTVEHVGGTTLLGEDTADAQMQIVTSGSNLGLDDTGPNAMIEIMAEGYSNAVTLKQILGKSTHIDQLSRSHLGMFSGRVIDASAGNVINGIRLTPTSGTVTGRWRVYYS